MCADGLDEMVQQCNVAIPAGKLTKLKHKNRLRIALARLVHVDDPLPAAIPQAQVNATPTAAKATPTARSVPTPLVAHDDRLSNALSRLMDGSSSGASSAGAARGAGAGAGVDDGPAQRVTNASSVGGPARQNARATLRRPSAEEFDDLDFLINSFALTEIERTSIRRRKSKTAAIADDKGRRAGPDPSPPPQQPPPPLRPPPPPLAHSVAPAPALRAEEPPAAHTSQGGQAQSSPGTARKRALPQMPPTTTARTGASGGGAPVLPVGQSLTAVTTSATGGSSWVVAPKKKAGKKGETTLSASCEPHQLTA
jgi:hypothetical protein